MLNPTLILNTEKINNLSDNTDNTSMTIDDSSNSSSLSITLEPIEKRTLQCIIMDVCNTEDFTRDEHGFILKENKTM